MYCRGFRAKLNKCAAENHNGSVISSHCGVAQLVPGAWLRTMIYGYVSNLYIFRWSYTHSHSPSQPSQKVKMKVTHRAQSYLNFKASQ